MKRILLAFIAALALLPAFAQLSVDGTKTSAGTVHVGGFTWAARPTCGAALTGYTARISDVGPAPGIRVMCDGARWLPDGGQVLARSNVSVSAPADTNEDTLATITIPAGLLGVDGSVRLRAQFSYTNSANAKTLRVRFGGAAGTVHYQSAPTTTTYTAADVWISNKGSAGAQIGQPNGLGFFSSGGLASSAVTSATDTIVATSIVVSCGKALGTETCALDRYVVEVWP